MQILRKLAPLLPTHLLAPLASLAHLAHLGVKKNFLGGFWYLSELKFEEISPKIPRMQILRKLAPPWPPFTCPPVPPGGPKVLPRPKNISRHL